MRFPRLAAVPMLLGLLVTSVVAEPGAKLAPRPKLDSAVVQRTALVGLEDLRDIAIDDTGGQVVLTRVDAASPWYALGLRSGDVLVAFGGDTLDSKAGLTGRAFRLRYADVTYFEIVRRGKPLVLRRVIEGDALIPTPAPTLPADPAVAAELDRLVVHKGGTTWEVDIDPIAADPMHFAKGARVVPSVKDGKPYGFKLYAIRPGSFYARLGIHNGDTILRVNGHLLEGMDKALEIYTSVRTADKIEVELIRRGKPVHHTYLRRKAPAPKP